jgi:predicted phage terminase large subunit-like protein
MSKWQVCYRKAYNDDGTLFFPEKLSHEFLESAKRSMGLYIFTNQYLNEIIPKELQSFKPEWFHYYETLPKCINNFVFIDPALSETKSADSTGIVVVAVDHEKQWYIRFAQRFRVTPTQLISKIFELNQVFSPKVIGIETVAYQKALLYFLDEEMRRRKIILPIQPVVPPTNKTKEMRILSMVPRFEWGHMFMAQGLHDLEKELLQFPRGSHDDLIDALASIEYIYYPPELEPRWKTPPHPSHPDYEKWYIETKLRSQKNGES